MVTASRFQAGDFLGAGVHDTIATRPIETEGSGAVPPICSVSTRRSAARPRESRVLRTSSEMPRQVAVSAVFVLRPPGA